MGPSGQQHTNLLCTGSIAFQSVHPLAEEEPCYTSQGNYGTWRNFVEVRLVLLIEWKCYILESCCGVVQKHNFFVMWGYPGKYIILLSHTIKKYIILTYTCSDSILDIMEWHNIFSYRKCIDIIFSFFCTNT